VSSACAWTESCSAGGRTARPAAAVVPLPPAVWFRAAVTSIAHFVSVLRGVPGANFGLRLDVRTGVLLVMFNISRQILCYWAYYKIGHDSIVLYPLSFSFSNLTPYNLLFLGEKCLTLNLLTTTIVAPPSNASK
jgi:hypothetical protein